MTESRTGLISRGLALLLLLVLIERLVLVRMAFAPLVGVPTTTDLLVVVWLWLLLLLGAVAGLLPPRRWGAYLLLILVPVSTLLLSVPLLPWITQLVPQSYRIYAMLLANGTVLVAALGLVHHYFRRPPAGRAAG